MVKCESHFQHGLEYRCYATEHPAVCSCGGDQSKCDFFPFLPEKRTPKQKQIHCKDCLHFSVCDLWRRCEGQDASCMQSSGCVYFKDRSQFVELPCEIGADLWWIDEESNSVQCHKSGVAGILVKSDGVYVMDECGSIDKIGTKWCYLTKEDAEKALAEGWRRE